MNYATRFLLVIVVGAVAIAVDKFVAPIPPPPGWLLAWAAWIAAGLTLLFGGKVLADIGAALASRAGSTNRQ